METQAKSDPLSIPRKLVKGLALAVGFCATLLCLMALVGLATDSGWIRVPVALIVTVGLPALIGDRLLPEDTAKRKPGLLSDVFALTWMALPLLIAVLLNGVTRGLLTREGDRLARADWPTWARAAYLLAGVDSADSSQPQPSPAASASASASASVSASASSSAKALASAKPKPTASASASASASGSAKPPAKPPTKDEGDKLTPAELFTKWAPSVVTVNVKGAMDAEGGGTGFLIDDKGTIATNYHVIREATEARIKFMSGAIFEEVWLLVEDSGADLALLRVDPDEPTEGKPVEVRPVELGDSDAIVVGERAISIGNPLGLEHTLTDGLISARRLYMGKQWIQISTPISPGNSGGPMFNIKGEVIGVSTAQIGGYGRGQNLNLAVPINALKALIKPSYPGQRKLGKSSGASQW